MKRPIASSIAALALLVTSGTAALGATDKPIEDSAQLEQALKVCTGATNSPERRKQAKTACSQVIQSPVAEDDAKFAALMARGRLDRHDWAAQALSDFNDAIELQPNAATAHYWRGVMLSSMNSKDDALRAFDKAISLDADFVDAHLARANRLAMDGRSEEAFDAYDSALRLAPDNAPALIRRGSLHAKTDKQAALEDFDKAIALQPDYVEALTRRGQLYAEMGKEDLALADFDKAVAVAADTKAMDFGAKKSKATLLYRRAKAFADEGAHDDAVQAYSAVLDLVYDTDALVRRGESYYALGRYKQALADFDKTIADFQRRREELKRESESGGRGSTRAGALLARSSPPAAAINGRKKALCQLEGGKDCDPTKTTDKATTARAKPGIALDELLAQCKGKDPVKAVDGCTQILDSDAVTLSKEDRGYLLHQRGRAYFSQNKLRSGMLDFTAALEHGATPEPVLLDRGRLFVRAKEYGEAIKDLTAALKLNAENGSIYYFRAAAYAGSGELDLATKDFDTALGHLKKSLQSSKAVKEHLRAGLDHHNQGNLGAAGNEYLFAAVWAEPGSATRAQALELLSRADLALGKHEVALAGATTLLALRPDYAPGYNTRGMVLRSLGQHDQAIADFGKAISLDPKVYTYAYLNNRGLSYFELGQYDLAIKDYDEAIRRKPDYQTAKNNKAEAEAALAQKE